MQTGIKSKLSYSSVKKRTRNSDRDRRNYDFTFLFSSTANPSSSANFGKVSGSGACGFSGKEYAAALSLVSLAILGTAPSDARSQTYEDECDLAQPKTRRSKRIARRSHYYGGYVDTDEWIPHLLDEMEDVRRRPLQKSVAMGVPCVWAAMGYSEYGDSCCACKKPGLLKKVTDASDRASTASDSAKSDFLTT